MSVLIKNMEMPKTCYDCIFYGGLECSLTGFDADRKDRHCPLVPVPPHGRLIDADALDYFKDDIGGIAVFDFVTRGQIHAAPTIIPAEEGKA